jgi:hypothetical protein
LLILENQRNLILENALAKETVKVEKLAIDLSLAMIQMRGCQRRNP